MPDWYGPDGLETPLDGPPVVLSSPAPTGAPILDATASNDDLGVLTICDRGPTGTQTSPPWISPLVWIHSTHAQTTLYSRELMAPCMQQSWPCHTMSFHSPTYRMSDLERRSASTVMGTNWAPLRLGDSASSLRCYE